MRCEIGYPYTPRRNEKSPKRTEMKGLSVPPLRRRVCKDLKTKEFSQSGVLAEWVVYHLGPLSPSPLFFVSVAYKGLSQAVSLLFATLARGSISVAAKGLKAIVGSGQWILVPCGGIRCTERMLRSARRPRETCGL